MERVFRNLMDTVVVEYDKIPYKRIEVVIFDKKRPRIDESYVTWYSNNGKIVNKVRAEKLEQLYQATF